jgi:predicted PurR-regulated permease PerM
MSSEGKNLSKVTNWLMPFSALFLILAYLSYTTVTPLLKPVAWAVLLAFFSHPMFVFLNNELFKGKHPSVCAAIMTVIIIFVIIAPTIMVGSVIARETIDLFTRYQHLLRANPFPIDEILSPKIIEFINEYQTLRDILEDTVKNISTYGFRVARGFFGNTLGLIYSLLVIFVSYFFLVRDGHIILNYIKDIVPLVEEEQMKFMNRGNDALRGVVYGIMLTAIIQGALGTIGWWAVDLPSPLLFGALMTILVILPFVGASFVWIPGVIYLFMSEDYKNAIILAIWGSCVIGMIDTFMRPKFISAKANISTFLVFMGVIGGIAVWGFLGVFMGPLILSLSVFFLDNYRELWKLSLKSDITNGNGRNGMS